MKRSNYSMDSLKLRIPDCWVTVLEEKLHDSWVDAEINTDSGDIDYSEDFKKRSFKVESHGVKTKYLKERITINKIPTDFVCILFNSKLLGSDYFDGITKSNIERVYIALMNQGVIRVKYDHFLMSQCTDVDFKTDYYGATPLKIDKVIKCLKENSKTTIQREKGFREFRENDNRGIEWSKRAVATPSNPYIKLYDKKLELENNSVDFKNQFFPSGCPDFILRCEFTIKGKKHLKQGFSRRLKAQFMDEQTEKYCNVLSFLLELSQEVLHEMSREILQKHLEGGYVMKIEDNKTKPSVSPAETYIRNSVILLKGKFNMELSEIVKELTFSMDRRNKSKYKQRIGKYYTEKMDEDESNTEFEVLDFLDDLGVV